MHGFDNIACPLADLRKLPVLLAAGPQMQTLAAVLGIFGALDVPIVYMSNRWWRTRWPGPGVRRQTAREWTRR